MVFQNVTYFGSDFRFHQGDVAVGRGKILDVQKTAETGDFSRVLLPGLVDIHLHGCMGSDFSDGDYEGLKKIAVYEAQNGITSFSPASMALGEVELQKTFQTAARLKREAPEGLARIAGTTMEGPFFSAKRIGAQPKEHLKLPDMELFQRLNRAAEGLIKIVCVAPELEGALQFIQQAKAQAVVSIAHTDADYGAASAGFEAGASHVTHMFNAMPPLLHRAPGVIGAAMERENVAAEIICDGIHIHESAVRAAFRLLSPARICLISDSIRACGMPDGRYFLGGQEVWLNKEKVTLTDGTIAGSAVNLFQCMKKAMEFGIAPEAAVRAATYNPAKVLGMEDEIGSIAQGGRADLIECNGEFDLMKVYIDGNPVR